ncbi:MAG: M48 family metallopeptidase [Campylobacterota bacterium]|nr:M48 family metallopeptidase [Campylobacterota bacterium]
MLETVVLIYTLYIFLKIYISFMQIGYINDAKRETPVLMSASKYFVAGNYAVAKERLSLVENFVDYLLFLWWVIAGFAWIQGLLQVEGAITQAVLFLFGFFAVNYLVTLPLSLYQTFKIDEDFKFNKMTPKLFIIDQIKSLAMFVLIGGVLFAMLAWIITSYDSWWLWGFLLLFGVAVVVNIIYPTIIAPIFNKFNPLEEGELKDAIVGLMQSVGLKSDGIFVMDASKRDSRLNAYFGGLGKSKRVVLFDTLLDKLSKEELLAVLGHELGHFTHGDIWKNIALMGGLLFVSLFLLGHLPDELFVGMGTIPTAGVKIAMMMLLLPVISFLFTPVMSYVSRHNEYAADEFGSQMGGRENLVSALMKLVTENKAFPKSHPLVIFFYYTHPPIIERLKELGYDATNTIVGEDEELKREGIFTFVEDEKDREA